MPKAIDIRFRPLYEKLSALQREGILASANSSIVLELLMLIETGINNPQTPMSHRYPEEAGKSSLDDNRPLAVILESLREKIADLMVDLPESASATFESLLYYTREFGDILNDFREMSEIDIETRGNRN